MLIKATLEYSDGTSASFTGEPIELATLPVLSPDELNQQESHATAPVEAAVEAPVEATTETTEAPAEEAVETPAEETTEA